jgi:two-component system response regulator AgrA
MIKIYVCEDQVSFRKSLVTMIEGHIEASNYKMTLALETDSPEVMMKALEKNKSKNIYFLDIQLNHTMNGIELAEQIRKIDQEGLIVFITSHGEMAYLTFEYKVKAFDYVVKDEILELKNRLENCLDRANEKILHKEPLNQESFSVKLSERQFFVPYEEIMFFETAPTAHKVQLNALRQQLEFYGKLSEIEKEVNEHFIRSHRSYLVNTRNIQSLDLKNKLIKMKNGQVCYYSSKGLKALKEMIE